MDERQLVELITREVIKRLIEAGVSFPEGGIATQPQCLPLILFAGRMTNNATTQNVVALLEKSPEDFRILTGEKDSLPENLRTRCVEVADESAMESLFGATSQVIVPLMSLAVLSRVAHLEPCCKGSLLITKALVMGVPVKAQKIFLEPEMDLYQQILTPTPIIRRVQGLISEARQMGMEWLANGGLHNLFAEKAPVKGLRTKGILTEADVRQMKDQGVISVPRGTIITPLARDEVKRYKLRLSMD